MQNLKMKIESRLKKESGNIFLIFESLEGKQNYLIFFFKCKNRKLVEQSENFKIWKVNIFF